MEINAAFRRKDTDICETRCRPEKAVILTSNEYKAFKGNLMGRYQFIKDNMDIGGYAEDGTYRCFLVTGVGIEDGILVNTEGSDYARYTAFIPQAQTIFEKEITEAYTGMESGQEEEGGPEMSI